MSAPFCINCVHYQREPRSEAGCKRTAWVITDIVTGEERDNMLKCSAEREDNGGLFGRRKCGPMARFFDPGD